MPALPARRIFTLRAAPWPDPDSEAVLSHHRSRPILRTPPHLLLSGLLTLATGGCTTDAASGGSTAEFPSSDAAGDQTSQATEAADFRVLFDGSSLEAWRGYRSDSVPSSWSIDPDGNLAFEAVEGGRGDLITVDEFANFELALEWRVSEGGNSGILFHVDEDHDWPWESGPEMQVLDDARHADGQSPLTSAGSNYALHAPSADVVNPAGQWNEVRLIVNGDRVEHWLNGVKIVEYTLGSPEWQSLVQASKFVGMPAYGRARRGHIVLQDHGDRVWFRDIRIREISRAR